MKAVFSAFGQFIRAIWEDAMLAGCLFMPFVMALVFRYGVPALEGVLFSSFGVANALTPYYVLFDLGLSFMTPLMLCFSGVMVVLEELDDGTASYLMVTPLRRAGYLASRIVILTALSVVYDVALLALFSLSGMGFWLNLICALCNALVSVSVAMMVVGFARNKVEGMALIKLSGFFILGYFAAYFLTPPLAHVAGVLPEYWLALMVRDGNLLLALPAVAVALVWIALLFRRFNRRVMG